MKHRKRLLILGDIFGMIIALLVFVFPFIFMFLNSVKDRKEANLLTASIPQVFHWENYAEVFKTNDYVLIRAFKNSIVLTVFSVLGLVLVASMAGFVIQR